MTLEAPASGMSGAWVATQRVSAAGLAAVLMRSQANVNIQHQKSQGAFRALLAVRTTGQISQILAIFVTYKIQVEQARLSKLTDGFAY